MPQRDGKKAVLGGAPAKKIEKLRSASKVRGRRALGFESLESRRLLASGPFHSPIYQSGTGLHESGDNFTLEMADWNLDGYLDLIAVKRSGTGTNSTEIFVYSGANNFGLGLPLPYLLNTGTALPETNSDWDFKIARLEGTHPDLMAIHQRNTSSGFVELHILRGEDIQNPNIYQSIITPLPTGSRDWAFDFADHQGDGTLDLFGILKNAGASTELHVVNGANVGGGPFTQFLFQTPTALHSTDDTFDFAVADIDSSRGFPDLIAIKKSGTGTGTTEVHVLDGRTSAGASPYGWFSFHAATGLHVTDSSFEFDIVDFSNPLTSADGRLDLIAFKKAQTGTNSTEVHVFTGESLPLPGNATVPLPAGASSQINYSIPTAGSLIISTEYGPVAVNFGTIAGQAGSSITVSGDGTMVNIGSISVPVLELLANAGLKVTAGQVDVPMGIVVAGSLSIDVSATVSSSTPLTVQAGGALSGGGAVNGTTTIGSAFVPGSLAILSPGNSPGRLTIDQLTLNPGSLYIAEIDGEFHDQVVANQLVMNQPRLRIEFLGAPVAGKEYVLFRQGGNQAFAGQFLTEDGAPIAEGDIWSNDFGGTGLTARVSYQGGDGNDFAVQVDGPMAIWFDAQDDVGIINDIDIRIARDGNYVFAVGSGNAYIPGNAYARRLASSITGIDVRRHAPDFDLWGWRQPVTIGKIEVDPSLFALEFPDGFSVSSDYDRWSLLELGEGVVTSVEHDLITQGEQLARVTTNTDNFEIRYTNVYRMQDRLQAQDKVLSNRTGDDSEWSVSSDGGYIQALVQSPSVEVEQVAIWAPQTSLLIDSGDGVDHLDISDLESDIDLEVHNSGFTTVSTSGSINLRSLLLDADMTNLGAGSIITSGTQIYEGGTAEIIGSLTIDAAEWTVNSNLQLYGDYLTCDAPLIINGSVDVYQGTYRPTQDITGPGFLIISGQGHTTSLFAAIEINSAINIENLKLIKGMAIGSGVIHVSDRFEWYEGLIAELVTVELGEFGTGQFGSSTDTAGNRLNGVFRNFGSVNYQGLDIDREWSGVGAIQNKPQATFYLQAALANYYNAPMTFLNEGTLIKIGDFASSLGHMQLTNSGLVLVQEGSLTIQNASSSGTIEIAEGSKFVSQGYLGLSDGAQVIGDGFLEDFVVYPEGSISISGDVSVRRLRLNSLRTGSGTLTIQDRFEWIAGRLAEGTTILSSGGTGEINGLSIYPHDLASTFINYGVMTQTSKLAFGYWGATQEPRLENRLGGTYLLKNEIQGSGQSNGFINQGTVIKSGANSSSLYGIILQNSGLIRVEEGVLSVGGGESNGQIEIEAGATVDFPYNPWNLQNFRLFDGASVSGLGDLIVPAGVIGGVLEVGAGTVHVERLRVESQLSFLDAGRLVVTHGFEQVNGSIAGTGLLELDSTAVGYLSGGISLSDAILRNFGTVQINASLAPTSGLAKVQNEAGATFIIHAGSYYSYPYPIPELIFENRGTLRHIGIGDSDMRYVGVQNSGRIEVLEGILRIGASGPILNGNASVHVSPSAVLNVRSSFVGDTTNPDSVTIEGTLAVASEGPPYNLHSTLEAFSKDIGPTAFGFQNNFAYQQLSFPTWMGQVQLLDLSDNSPGTGSEAVYTRSLFVGQNTTLDLNGLNLYTSIADIQGSVVNGSVSFVRDAQVVGSYVYHKGSVFADVGNNIPAALDTDKQLAKEGATPQPLGFENLINSSRGINGLVFDITDLPGTVTASDFVFQMSPQGAFSELDNPPANWLVAPAPSSVSVLPDLTSRIVIQWPDNAIANRWLRIVIQANENTGLTVPEVYYIGHLLGETTGPSGSTFTVSFADISPIRSAVGNTVSVGNAVDIDKSGVVAFADISAMRPNVGAQLTIISIPAAEGSGGGGSFAAPVDFDCKDDNKLWASSANVSLFSDRTSLHAAAVDLALDDLLSSINRRKGRRS